MPYAVRYFAPSDNSSQAHELWNRYSLDKSERTRRYDRALMAYEGSYRDVFKSADDYTVRLNPIRFAVNSDVYRMIGISSSSDPQTISFEVVGDTSSVFVPNSTDDLYRQQASPEQLYLDKFWELNLKEIFLQELFTSSCIYGHVFLKVVPDGLIDPFSGQTYPRLILLNPRNVSVFWSSRDVGQVLWYRIYVTAGEEEFIEDHIPTQEGWQVKTYIKRSGKYETFSEDQLLAVPLIYDWKNLPNAFDYYGTPDFTDTVIDLNKTAIFVASNIAKIIKHHAHPKTIGIGIAPNQVVATAVDQFWAVPNEKAQIFNLEMKSDLSSSRQFLMVLLEEIYAEMREVNPVKEGRDLDQVTNFAVRVLYYPALIKTSIKRTIVAPALSWLCRNILVMGGFTPHAIKVHFPQTLPKDPNADAQALSLDRANGLSMDTYLEARGYNPALERYRRSLEESVNRPSVVSGVEGVELP